MSGLGNFVSTVVPVDSFSRVVPDKARTIPDPDVGARWGRPAVLDFQLPPSLGGEEQKQPIPVVFDDDELIERIGHGFAASEDPPTKPFFLTKYFDCGYIDEYKEETKDLGNNVTEIDPHIIHWHVFFKMDFVPEIVVVDQYSIFDVNEDVTTRDEYIVLVDASWNFTEQLPPKYLGQGTGPQRRWNYSMQGASPI